MCQQTHELHVTSVLSPQLSLALYRLSFWSDLLKVSSFFFLYISCTPTNIFLLVVSENKSLPHEYLCLCTKPFFWLPASPGDASHFCFVLWELILFTVIIITIKLLRTCCTWCFIQGERKAINSSGPFPKWDDHLRQGMKDVPQNQIRCTTSWGKIFILYTKNVRTVYVVKQEKHVFWTRK